MYLFPYLSVLQSVEVSPQPPALNAVPPTSHRWAPTRPAEGEPDTAFAGLSKSRKQENLVGGMSLRLCPKKRIWSTRLFHTWIGTMACATGNDQTANSAELSV